jgi:hypothetical protein
MKQVLFATFVVLLSYCPALADCMLNGVLEGQNVVKKFDDDKLYVCKGNIWLTTDEAEKNTLITITSALYGWQGAVNNVTAYYKNLCDEQHSCDIQPTNAKHGDPKPGPRKSLTINWVCGSQPNQSISVAEDEPYHLSCS